MRKKILLYFGLIALALALAPAALWADMQSTNFVIWADVFSSGGREDGSSANFKIQDTIGESMILSATSTSANYGIKAGFRELYPTDYITFTVGSTTIDLGTLSSSVVKSASHTMTVDTNAGNGFVVTVSGSTLTKAPDTISAIGGTETASTPGTEQFGINLVANASPAVGTDPTGAAPRGAAANHYNVANSFAFLSGDTIATSTVPVNSTVYKISYIANITATTETGIYTTTLTYAATANF